MITTIAKAETSEETPAFVGKFKKLDDPVVFIHDLKGRGYTHYQNLKTPKRVSVGSLDYEFRLLIAVAFFRGNPPSFEELRAGIRDNVPVLEQRKYYAYMSGIGRSDFGATLTGAELSEWISFFEPEPGTVREIDEFFS
jgi:hypothetical protein